MPIPDLAVLFSPVVAAPIVRWAANVFAARLGGRPAWWGLGLAFVIELGLAFVLFAPVTGAVLMRAVLYSIFAFVGAFGVNEYLAARTLANSPSARMISGPKPALPPGSWMAASRPPKPKNGG